MGLIKDNKNEFKGSHNNCIDEVLQNAYCCEANLTFNCIFRIQLFPFGSFDRYF